MEDVGHRLDAYMQITLERLAFVKMINSTVHRRGVDLSPLTIKVICFNYGDMKCDTCKT